MDSQAVLGTRPPSLLSRMKETREHQDKKKQTKTNKQPKLLPNARPAIPLSSVPRGRALRHLEWSRVELAGQDRS